MKIGICDDLISEQELIKKYCNHLGYDQIYTYQSGKELLNAKELPDLNLLFLDIEMEEKTVLCKDILYLHSEQKYTIFYMTDGQTITVRKPIKEWKTDLAPLGFCLISRSSIINLKYYRKTEKRQALLTGNVTLPVSRTCLSKLAEAYDAYILEFMHT